MNVHSCIFCRIIARSAPAFLLCEDEHSLAFMDINPVAPGHALIVSKTHAETIFDLPIPDLQAVSATVKKVAQAVNSALLPDGISVVQSNGRGAAQSVLHFHMHVVPRTMDDGLLLNWSLRPGELSAIEAMAERIRAYL